MQKYKIQFTQKEDFIIDVLATSQEEATRLAHEAWNIGNYQETCDIEVDISGIFDVTNTDDPFNPINDEDTTLSTTNTQE